MQPSVEIGNTAFLAWLILRKGKNYPFQSLALFSTYPLTGKKSFPLKLNITKLLSLCSFRGIDCQVKTRLTILLIILIASLPLSSLHAQLNAQPLRFDFYGDSIQLELSNMSAIPFETEPSPETIQAFYRSIQQTEYHPLIQKLLYFKEKLQLDDWLYFQLIRSTAERISPKAINYNRYTLYKWFLLAQSGYDASLSCGNNKLLLYIQTNENIYDIPYHTIDGKQYVCLNYHDYKNIDFAKDSFAVVSLPASVATHSFSYKVTQMPNFRAANYAQKDLRFVYADKEYHFNIMLNPQVKNIFANYPVVDYESFFNIPMSKETYGSLIPQLKNTLQGMSLKDGVDYLMRFTRYAFAFEKDLDNFGKEKRLSPEQTLLYDHSDCEDRAALFFYLTKEIYNLPMITLIYPTHVTIAVKFDKPFGKTIDYKGSKYSVCEPTPQKKDLNIGMLPPSLKNVPFEVAYEYNPVRK